MWIADTEADGFVEEATKLHCLVAKKFKSNKWVIGCRKDQLPKEFVDELEDKYNISWKDDKGITDFTRTCQALVIHNLFGYDLKLLKKLGYINSYDIKPENIDGVPTRLIDSLSMSRALYPDRPLPDGCPSKVYNPVTGRFDTVGPHGLMAWGYRVANAKPEVHDWRDQPLEVYVHRCIEDVIINELMFIELIKESQELSDGKIKPPLGLSSEWKTALRINSKSDFLMEKQEEDGILFDVDKARKLVVTVDEMMKEIEEYVEPQLPRRDIPKSKRPTFPANPFKDDGTVSSYGWNWLKDKLGYPVDEEVLSFQGPPKTAFKRDGELSVAGLKYCDKMGFEGDDESKKEFIRSQRVISNKEPLPEDLMQQALEDLHTQKMPDLTEPMKISNQDDIKKYLVKVEGWNPTIWRTKDVSRDDQKKNRPESEVEERIKTYIEDVKESPYKKFIYAEMGLNFETKPLNKVVEKLKRQARYLITSPKLKDERGELCPTLKNLKGELAKNIVKWLSLRNRRSVLKALDEKKETGWLNNARLLRDGRIGQGNSGPTNTNRYKHRTVVNLPKADPSVLLGYEMRDLFIAPPNKKILGYDGSNLEQFVAASYAYHYDNGKYASELKGDAHQTNSEAYTKAAGRFVSRSEGKNITYACVPVDNSEVLTRNGWKSYSELTIGEDVLSYSEELCHYEWKPITHLWFYEDAEVVEMSNNHMSLESTGNHRWYGYKRKMKGSGKTAFRYKDKGFNTTDELNSECAIRHAANYWNDDSHITPDQAALVAWLLSDGYYHWSEKSETTSSSHGKREGIVASICQADHKFQKEITDVLDLNNIPYVVDEKKSDNTNKVKQYRLGCKEIRDFLDTVVGSRLQKHDVDWVSWVLKLDQPSLKSFFHHFWLADGHTSKRGIKHITQNLGNICDAIMLVGNLLGKRVTFNRKTDKCIVMNFNDKPFTTGQRITKKVSRETDVFCLTNDNGSFVMRQNGFITLTGNCLYGAQKSKIAKMLGVSEKTGQEVIDAFWDTNYGLKALKESLERYWEKTGKKYIRGIDGRKIYTRSKHSLVNALFQSCGSIIMFVSGCFMYDMLKAEGFLDNGVKRLAFIHDEYQYEIPEDIIETFVFETKDEAKEFEDGRLLSNIKEIDGKFYKYYCRVGELGDLSLQKAGKFFNMPLPFNAAYDIGNSLAETH